MLTPIRKPTLTRGRYAYHMHNLKHTAWLRELRPMELPNVKLVRIVLIGFGAVNRELTSIISRKRESLLASHRIAFEIVGVCDSTSAVCEPCKHICA